MFAPASADRLRLEEVDASVVEIPYDADVAFESASVSSNARREVPVCRCRHSQAPQVKPYEVPSRAGRAGHLRQQGKLLASILPALPEGQRQRCVYAEIPPLR